MRIKNHLKSRHPIARELKRYSALDRPFDIIIRADGVELNEKLREAVATKIGRVRQYAPRAFRARVQFEREHMNAINDRFRVSVLYEIPGRDIVAQHRAHDPMAALDLVSEKIERRLRKRKTARLASRLGRKARTSRIARFFESLEP